MERKKKHSIIWLIIIVVAIVAIVLITIAGARNGDTTAYAAEIEENNTGIESITMWGSGSNVEPKQELYFEWVQTSETTNKQGRAVIKSTNELQAKEYNINIAYIGNPKRFFTEYTIKGIGISTNNSENTNIIANDNGVTEYQGNINIENNTNQINIDWFFNTNNLAPNGTYWVNILQLQIYDENNNYIVNYESYLYSYLKNQFENANSSGYENGYNDGESLYRNNPFNGAALISATVIKDKYDITDAPLNLLSNGISFNSLQLAADDHMVGKEEFEGEQGWTVKFSVIPFIFEQNQIYISQSYGFASLIMTDINNNTYNISWGDTLTKLGYALTGSTAYGKTIKQIQITFANTDYVGTLYVGQTAAQDSAYNEGYNKGYNQGHIDGYNQATTDSNGPSWAINKLVSTVSAGLSTDIIGEISIGDILSVMLGILLTFAVIRFFGGG